MNRFYICSEKIDLSTHYVTPMIPEATTANVDVGWALEIPRGDQQNHSQTQNEKGIHPKVEWE